MRILKEPISKSDLIRESTNFIEENAIKDDIDDLVEFDSMINIRPSQGNRSRSVEDPTAQAKVKEVVEKWLL